MLILGISCTKYCSIFEEVDLAKYSSNSVLLIIFANKKPRTVQYSGYMGSEWTALVGQLGIREPRGQRPCQRRIKRAGTTLTKGEKYARMLGFHHKHSENSRRGSHTRTRHLPDLLREMWQEDATRSQEGEKHFCYLYIFLSGNTWNESGFGVNDNSQSKEFSLSHWDFYFTKVIYCEECEIDPFIWLNHCYPDSL